MDPWCIQEWHGIEWPERIRHVNQVKNGKYLLNTENKKLEVFNEENQSKMYFLLHEMRQCTWGYANWQLELMTQRQ